MIAGFTAGILCGFIVAGIAWLVVDVTFYALYGDEDDK